MKGSKKQPAASDISVPGVDLGQLERLLSFMSQHGLEEFEYAHGDLRIRLKKAIPQSGAAPALALPVAQAAAPQSILAQAPPNTPQSAPQASPESAQPASPAAASADEHIIKSPIVGTYYAGSSPDAGPFVRVGDFVEAGQTVCIIEAMKLMNEIEADVGGEVVRVLIENGQPVEYGEPLFALRPTGKKK
jgi:acetyl-CoA carboxylase biotin carboxyl carrier protein